MKENTSPLTFPHKYIVLAIQKIYLEYMTCESKCDMNVPKIVKIQFSNYPGYPTWTRGTSEFLIS